MDTVARQHQFLLRKLFFFWWMTCCQGWCRHKNSLTLLHSTVRQQTILPMSIAEHFLPWMNLQAHHLLDILVLGLQSLNLSSICKLSLNLLSNYMDNLLLTHHHTAGVADMWHWTSYNGMLTVNMKTWTQSSPWYQTVRYSNLLVDLCRHWCSWINTLTLWLLLRLLQWYMITDVPYLHTSHYFVSIMVK